MYYHVFYRLSISTAQYCLVGKDLEQFVDKAFDASSFFLSRKYI